MSTNTAKRSFKRPLAFMLVGAFVVIAWGLWASATDSGQQSVSSPQSAQSSHAQSTQDSAPSTSADVSTGQTAEQTEGFVPLPPVKGAGEVVKKDAPSLSADDAEKIIDKPAREVAKRFLKRYYTYYTTTSDPNTVVGELGRYTTPEYAVKLINIEALRMQGIDERKWDVLDVKFTNVTYAPTDVTRWEADATISLEEQEGVDLRQVAGHIKTEVATNPHYTTFLVTSWEIQ